MSSQEIKNLILTRRTVHHYNDKPVSENLIHEAIECLLHAPNHRFTQPWKVKTINQEQRKTIAKKAVELKSKKSALTDIQKIAINKKFQTPSHLIAILQIKSSDEYQSKEDYAAISCGIMNMSLFLWSHKVGTKWSSGEITNHPSTYQILNIKPEVYQIIGFLWAGHFDHSPKTPLKLRPEDIIL